jgi:hypothetical protein
MKSARFVHPAPVRLGLVLVLAASSSLLTVGCGGQGTQTGDAVVVPAPDANLPAGGTTTTAPAGGTGTAASTSTTSSAPAAASTAASPAPASPTKAEGWGTLKGQVTLKGDAPAPKELAAKGKASKDPDYCAKDAPIVSERLVVDSATKGVKNVLVYIPKPSAVSPEARSATESAGFVFDQEKCAFVPHIMALMTGTKVELKNSDPVSHNINSQLRNNGFNTVVPAAQAMPRPLTEAEKQPGVLTCDIHPWMKAYWIVLDNPYFAVTDEKGNFEIKNVPAGTQKVVVWQEAVAPSGFLTPPAGENVDIKPGDATAKNYTIDATKLRPE